MLHRSNLVNKRVSLSYSEVVRDQGKRIAVLDSLSTECTVVHAGPQASVFLAMKKLEVASEIEGQMKS